MGEQQYRAAPRRNAQKDIAVCYRVKKVCGAPRRCVLQGMVTGGRGGVAVEEGTDNGIASDEGEGVEGRRGTGIASFEAMEPRHMRAYADKCDTRSFENEFRTASSN